MKICLRVLQLALPLNLKSAQVYILEETASLPVDNRRLEKARNIMFPQLMFFPGDAPVAITQNVA